MASESWPVSGFPEAKAGQRFPAAGLPALGPPQQRDPLISVLISGAPPRAILRTTVRHGPQHPPRRGGAHALGAGASSHFRAWRNTLRVLRAHATRGVVGARQERKQPALSLHSMDHGCLSLTAPVRQQCMCKPAPHFRTSSPLPRCTHLS